MRLASLVLLFATISASATPSSSEVIVADGLQRATVDFPVTRRETWRESLLKVYRDRSFAPLWFASDRPTAAALALRRELGSAERRGLRSEDYAVPAFDGLGVPRDETARRQQVLDADVALTAATTRFAMDLHAGRVDPRRLGHDLDVKQAHVDVGPIVAALAQSEDVRAALDALEPQLALYGRLKDALRQYRTLSGDPSLTRLPRLPKRSLASGDRYAGAAALRSLLTAVGDWRGERNRPVESPEIFDASLSQAVMRFQERHGLEVDGVLGPATYRALTVPLSHRASQIELSLERARWLPKLDRPPIIVNVPQFRLFAFRSTRDDVASMLQMDVVVGEAFPEKRTPVFAAEMRYVVLRPYWDVPRNILLREMLPLIRRDPGWVRRNDYEIVRGGGDDATVLDATHESVELLAAGRLRLRQRPGPQNALGQVKFMLPNAHDVYLHDTPAKALFGRHRRAFSHGCIRVADPQGLLAHVLADEPSRRDEALAQMQQNGSPVRVKLLRPIPVFILYGTALVRGSGEVLFFEDIYQLDDPLAAAMVSRTR